MPLFVLIEKEKHSVLTMLNNHGAELKKSHFVTLFHYLSRRGKREQHIGSQNHFLKLSHSASKKISYKPDVLLEHQLVHSSDRPCINTPFRCEVLVHFFGEVQ